MKEVPTGAFRQGMYQQRALHIARYHQLRGGREILARVLVVPSAVSRRKRLQSKYLRGSGAPVARNAASMATTLGQKDRLHFSFKELKIKLRGFAGGLLGRSSRRCTQQASQQSPAKDCRCEKALHLRLPQRSNQISPEISTPSARRSIEAALARAHANWRCVRLHPRTAKYKQASIGPSRR